MFEDKSSFSAKSGEHWLFLLLPFICGLYFADFRENTEQLLNFIQLFSLMNLLLWLLYAQLKKVLMLRFLLLSSFFILGYWHMYFSQQDWIVNKNKQFFKPIWGQFIIEDLESKAKGQLLFGNFRCIAHGQVQELAIQVYTNRQSLLQTSDKLIIEIKPEAIKNEKQPGAFDLERYLQFKGSSHQAFLDSTKIFSIKQTTSQNKPVLLSLTTQRKNLCKLFYKYLKGEAADIAVALIIGDRSGVDEKSRAAFQGTGSMHIMAVSGMHIALLLNVLLKFGAVFGKWISRKTCIYLLLILIWYYAFLTGLSAAVLRSVVMFTLLLIGQLSGRQVSSILILYFSAFLILLYHPLLIFDLGFQLSYMAMWGIFLFYPAISSRFVFRWTYLQTLWEGTALGLAATISTAPLTLYYFHTFPNYFALANLFLMSLSSLILILGMLFPVFSIFPFIDHIAAIILQNCIQILLLIMDFFTQLPAALVQGFHFHFFWILGIWFALYSWCRFDRVFWRLPCLLFGALFLVELNLNRISQYNSSAIFWMQKNKVLVVKEKGMLKLFQFNQNTKLKYLSQGLEAYYGVDSQTISCQKNYCLYLSENVSMKVNCTKFQSIKLIAQTQQADIRFY